MTMEQHRDHVNAWLLHMLIAGQYDDHVWAWRSYLVQLRGFYAHLLQHQEPLGITLSPLDLWGLYAR